MTFPDEFFRDETREGFFVPELMKRAWAAELEVLQVVADICERYGIQWFADWGTMLGAVRHQGFIPWDDDIDICLKRPDYDRLVALLRTELPAGFVLTGMYAEDRRLQRAAAFPQSRVMADEEHWDLLSYMRRFHGFPFFRVGIDIFPVDGMPEDPKLVEEQKHRMMEIWRVLEKWIRNENYPLKNCEAQLKKIEKLCGISLVRDDTLANQLWRLYDSICSLYTVDDSEFMAEYHFLFNNGKRFYRKKCFKEAVWLPFENISLPVPVKYALHKRLPVAD